jgi:hypothetical protein
MKKVLVLITAIFIIQFSFAQYHPVVESNRTWKMTNYGLIQFFYNEFIGGDTLINNTTYSKLYELADFDGSEIFLVGLLREDEAQQKVFFFDGSQEFLLFDFDVQVDDQLSVYNLGSMVPITVTSIETVVVNGTNRKKINLQGEFYATFWIEGVGGHHGLRDGALGPIADYDPQLLCYYEGNDLRWDDPNDGSSCGITLSIYADQNAFSSIDVYPNPATERANLSFPLAAEGKPANLLIVDQKGKMCSAKRMICHKQNEIDISLLPAGVYHIMLHFDDGSYTSSRLMIIK